MTTSSERQRPLGETSGTRQRPSRRLAGSTLVFDVAAELSSLKQEESWQRGDRNARTLVEEPGFRLILTAVKTGSRVREHRTAGWVSVETVEGHVKIHTPEQDVDLPKGRILVLDTQVPHDIEAVEESAFLLSVAPSEHGTGR